MLCVAGSRALLEYYGMAAAAGTNDDGSVVCRPAKKCGTLALCAMYLTACGTAYGLPYAYTGASRPRPAPRCVVAPFWRSERRR